MLVVVERNATDEDIQYIVEKLQEYGFQVHRSPGVNQTVLSAIGVKPEFDIRQVQVLPKVADVHRITEPYKLASRSLKPEGTILNIKGVMVGSKEVVVMAGPCAVESEKQIFAIAEHVKNVGAKFLRGGAFKPRTSP